MRRHGFRSLLLLLLHGVVEQHVAQLQPHLMPGMDEILEVPLPLIKPDSSSSSVGMRRTYLVHSEQAT